MPEDKSVNDPSAPKGNEDHPTSVEVHYKRTDAYQSFHADGFVVGITPKGYINLEPFVERAAIPRVMLHNVDGKKIGPGKYVEGMQGVIRLIQNGLIIDIRAAESLAEILTDKVKKIKELMNEDKEGDGNAR